MPPVFVYGTLLFAEVTSALGIRARRLTAATLPDYQRQTVRLSPRGNFPAIVSRAGDSVTGALLQLDSQQDLDLMDEFEGTAEGYYERRLVTVLAEQREQEAFAYVCGPPLQPFLDGAWDAELFRIQDLANYVHGLRDHRIS